MTLIKCPSCDHTISSVASKCPRCGYQLTQPRFQQGNEGTLSECRRCGRKVLSKSRVCPYCGLKTPGRRPRTLAVVVLGAIAAAVALLAVQDQMVPIGLSEADTVSVAEPVPDLAGPVTRPVQTPPPAAATPDTVRPRQLVAAAPRESLPVSTAPDTVAVTEAADSLVLEPPVGTQTRWAADFANVREARSLNAPIVGMVRRGEAVQVANQAEGWWEVYRGGRFLGYVAADLLLTERPAIP